MEDSTLLYSIGRIQRPSPPVLGPSFLIASAISISEIVIGAMNLGNCPIQRYIPIYLVVTGVFTILMTLLLSCCTRDSDSDSENGIQTTGICCAAIILLFLSCWFIAGNVWIYSIYQPNYNPGKEPFCDKTVYLFAFWITTLSYISCGVLFVMCCCAFICGLCASE